MTDIPTTVIEFERWFTERGGEWPLELLRLGSMARMSLDYLDQLPENRHAKLDEMARIDLVAFAVAFGEWKANNGKSR